MSKESTVKYLELCCHLQINLYEYSRNFKGQLSFMSGIVRKKTVYRVYIKHYVSFFIWFLEEKVDGQNEIPVKFLLTKYF